MMNPTLDQTALDELTTIPRKELEEYGALLALLVEQQEYILQRNPDTLMKTNDEVEAQMQANHRLLEQRKGLLRDLSKQLGQEEESTVSQLIPNLPESQRPMFESLTTEINSLISNARRKVKQNQVLLSRLSEVTSEILDAVAPEGSITKTYDRRGDLNVSSNIEKRTLKATV
jgi:uncharacterized protein YidB (DUF937 family)